MKGKESAMDYSGYRIKKLLPVLLLAVLSVCVLSGCHGPQYKDDEKAALEEKGKAQMQAWLDGHVKGSQVSSAEADVYMYPSGPHYLTDYVAGTFTDDGKDRDYLINTVTGTVYLLHDGSLLSEVCLDYAFDKLELDALRDECRDVSCTAAMWIPDCGNSRQGTEDEGMIWMPGELTLSLEEAAEGEEQRKLLEDFVAAPDGRDAIEFGGSILVPDEVALEEYGMAYWVKQQEENGLKFDNFALEDRFESISVYNDRASYERYCFQTIEDPDIRIFMQDAYWVEKNDKDGIKVEEGRDYDISDLTFKKTENGYLVTFPDYEHVFGFTVYADEGSDFLQHEYHSHEDREAYLSPGSEISGDKYFEEDLYWKDAGEDGYLLTDADGYRKMFFGGEELIPRD